ncbi:hypothetical protein [Ramlibacter sp. Leaf400]|uniref:hypothetical protein n=1 Tax=Ramlibacter sp. Leaf400 TaxID=1736365 RepID=UPI0006F58AC4|nr:hypothetical protein [Ramlibacter sp. Leaf400]KQT13473.1 hypothetical protein ASG30_18775 [Ramlibacter sp. Leaf400]
MNRIAAGLAAWAFSAAPLLAAQGSCVAPGEPIQWRADYCMLLMGTDDEIAVSGCIEREGRTGFSDACAANTHFKRRMCERLIHSGGRVGTPEQCVRDPKFKGRTVEAGGVGS